ncbi:hypothetical protein ACFV0L_02980 [Streptosporangium canum]|uniref:hypothetical protein n=1 Tax=Streptosporangium canum TaxID=324952 RepID=UPI0036974081
MQKVLTQWPRCHRNDVPSPITKILPDPTRMLDWYQFAALKAMEHLSSEDSDSMTIVPVADGIPDLPGVNEAMAWLERERHVLIAVIVHAAERDRHIHAWQTAALLSWFFYAKNHFDDLFMTGEVGLSSARRIGHRHGEAEPLHALGRSDDAEKHWRTAVDILSPMDLPEAEVIAERMRAAGLT